MRFKFNLISVVSLFTITYLSISWFTPIDGIGDLVGLSVGTYFFISVYGNQITWFK